jgi:hypothetical protein
MKGAPHVSNILIRLGQISLGGVMLQLLFGPADYVYLISTTNLSGVKE